MGLTSRLPALLFTGAAALSVVSLVAACVTPAAGGTPASAVSIPVCPTLSSNDGDADGGKALCPDGGVGGLEKAIIGREIELKSPEVQSCYQSALQESWEGDLSLRWSIARDGRVASVCVAKASPNFPTAVTACVAEVVSRLHFSPPECGGTVSVTFPWLFRLAPNP